MDNVKVGATISVEITGHIHNGQLKTHPADNGEWYGSDICKSISVDSIIDENLKGPEGEYKITVTIEKISE